MSTPRLQAAEAAGDERVLLVDADHSSGCPGHRRPDEPGARTGKLTLYDLAEQGRTSTVDVRKATGDTEPDRRTGVAFDPTKPDTLRVVDGLAVWVVHHRRGQGHQGGRAARAGAGWIFAGGFNKNDGQPFIEEHRLVQDDPAGNGETSTRAVERTAGKVVPSDSGGFAGLPEAHCGLGTAFALVDGPTWAFCAKRGRIQARVLEPGASRWEDVGTPTGDVVAPNAEPTLVPPGALSR